MAGLSEAALEFVDLAKNLIAVGETDLRRELYRAIDEAAQPIKDEIKGVPHLREFMPDRYADVLAGDLQVTVNRRTGGESAGVTILGRAPTGGRGGRKIRQRESGVITHPLFGDKNHWFTQTAGMKPGFFSSPAERAAPAVREKILQAMAVVADKATGKG